LSFQVQGIGNFYASIYLSERHNHIYLLLRRKDEL